MKAVIMAGGNGQRLRPITCTLPKPMVRVCGCPVLDYVLNNLKKHSIYEAVITARYLNDVIISRYNNGCDVSMNISYSIEDAPLGTAGSVKKAMNNVDEDILVISGDGLSGVDISKAYEFHKSKNADVTMVLHRMENPLDYGVVITDKDDRVTRFCEKPSWCQVFSDTVNTGTYIISPKVMGMISEKCNYDFSTDLFPELLKQSGKIYGYLDNSYWCDIGNKYMYLQANKDVLSGKMEYYGSCTLMKNGIYYGKNVTVRPGAIIEEGVMLCDGCTVSQNVRITKGSVIGKGTFIGEGTSVKCSVISDNVYIGECCEIRGAIVCNGVRIGANTRIFENAVVGDETCVGTSVTINRDVGIWPRKVIDAGCIIDSDIVWDNSTKRDLLSCGVIRIKNSEDIHINDIMKYSASFSSLFNGDGVVCVGMPKSENTRNIQSVYHCICSGVILQSHTCIKINDTTLPIFKRFINDNKCDGGIYVSEINGEIIVIFLDKNGEAISSRLQKKICAQCGMISSLPYRANRCNVIENNTTVEMYENIMCNEFSHLKGLSGNVNIIGDDTVSTSLLKRILTRLGFNAKDKEKLLFTVFIGKMGDSALLIDERNNKITPNQLNTLISVIKREMGNDNSTSISLDIIREMSLKDGYNSNDAEYSCCGDSVYFTLSLLEYMNKSQKSVSKIIQGLPNIYISEKSVKCSWDKKGRIMRELYSRYNCDSDNCDMGIKINHDYGWSVIIPGEEKPVFRIISEGFSMEYADELCSIYAKKINQMLCEN